jgi:aconitate hydratase
MRRHDIVALAARHDVDLASLPYSKRVLLESIARSAWRGILDDEGAARAVRALTRGQGTIPFLPTRVVMQDYTAVPAFVDLATMREAVQARGGDPRAMRPVVPVDVVVDHSVDVDVWGRPDALARNAEREAERNRERLPLLRWAARAFPGVRVLAAGTGIVHQINLEHLASVVRVEDSFVVPDSVVGTDSHTTMVNALGVLGWGVGGLEAEAVMLGRPTTMAAPEVVGLRLTGRLGPGVTVTDLALTLAERLRAAHVVDAFVELTGEGLEGLRVLDRATLANMAPEYGATCVFAPVDGEVLAFLRATGRDREHVDLVERYCKEQRLFRDACAREPAFDRVVHLDLGAVEPTVAGPSRPEERRTLAAVPASLGRRSGRSVEWDGRKLEDGAVIVAAITSCTNTSNPAVMIAAGLLAKRAVERGLSVPSYVKTSLSPGSRVVTDYLAAAGLTEPLAALGFHVVGYGCMTCSGRSGPLDPRVEEAVERNGITAAAVLSGNRNFEGRIHRLCHAAYLASPPLVVAYALAGSVGVDLSSEPLGHDREGRPVHLADVWPSSEEVAAVVADVLGTDFAAVGASPRRALPTVSFAARYAGDVFLPASSDADADDALLAWDPTSTYVARAPYFDGDAPPAPSIARARVLAMLGDGITTDHLSPAGAIPPESPAGAYLRERGVRDLDSYGSRRGHHEVMMRATLANPRVENALVPGMTGGFTRHVPTGETMTIFEAAGRYRAEGTPVVVLAGKAYGKGSSRDWAAKGLALLGVRAVIAEGFERIHRQNLIGVGVLPLELPRGETFASLGIDGTETFDVDLGSLAVAAEVAVHAGKVRFLARARIDTPEELETLRSGGLLRLLVARVTSGPAARASAPADERPRRRTPLEIVRELGIEIAPEDVEALASRSTAFELRHLGLEAVPIGRVLSLIESDEKLLPPRTGHMGNWSDIANGRAGAMDFNRAIAGRGFGYPLIYSFNQTEDAELAKGDWVYLPGSLVEAGARTELPLYTWDGTSFAKRTREAPLFVPMVLAEVGGERVPLTRVHWERMQSMKEFDFRLEASVIRDNADLVRRILHTLLEEASTRKNPRRALADLISHRVSLDGRMTRTEIARDGEGWRMGDLRYASTAALVEATLLPFMAATEPSAFFENVRDLPPEMPMMASMLVGMLSGLFSTHYPSGVDDRASMTQPFNPHLHWGARDMAGYPPVRNGYFLERSTLKSARAICQTVIDRFPEMDPLLFLLLPSAVFMLCPSSSHPRDAALVSELLRDVARIDDAEPRTLAANVGACVRRFCAASASSLSPYFRQRFHARRGVLHAGDLPVSSEPVTPEGFRELTMQRACMVVGSLVEALGEVPS